MYVPTYTSLRSSLELLDLSPKQFRYLVQRFEPPVLAALEVLDLTQPTASVFFNRAIHTVPDPHHERCVTKLRIGRFSHGPGRPNTTMTCMCF